MRRRITAAIVGVTAIVLVLLGVPLAIAVQNNVLQSEVVELQNEAVRLLSDISVPLDPAELRELQPRDHDVKVIVYDVNGQRVTGPGAPGADALARRTLEGVATTDRSGQLVATTPITGRNDDDIVGALVLQESRQAPTNRIWIAWGVMLAAALVALGFAWVIARAVAGRISRPIHELADMAAQIGAGRVVDPPPLSAIAELDALGTTLATSSRQVHEVLARERRFSADVSHQLRTPLTHLRLTLESAGAPEDLPDVVESGLIDVTRLQATVDHLLAFSREALPADETTDLAAAVDAAATRWTSAASAAGRAVETASDSNGLVVRASASAIEQTLDVLIDNALRYGTGAVHLRARAVAGGGAVDVSDDGDATLDDTVFQRGTGNGHGIGLSLARSIVEAEGGRLLLTRRSPPTFSVVLLSDV